MIRSPHGGGNIESTMTAATDTASRYLLTGITTSDTNAVPTKMEPPPVLISPLHVAQMRERKRQMQALQQWAQHQEAAGQ
jgi:hypothetical protein